ncbi:DUF6804 family protein [Acinetobacter baumannii]|uniref:DUF6804 family protein n=1 Tax=Acinetobacter baumannii TaxID=470 RepID=UPI0034CD92CE
MGKLTFKRHYLFYISALYLLSASVGDFDFDYGFYQLLRFVAFFSFGFASFAAYVHKQQITPFILGLIAIVFNPFLPIYLERETWQLVDAMSGILLIVWAATSFKDALYSFFNRAIKKNKKASIAVLSVVAVAFLLILVGWPFVHKVEEPAAASSEYLYSDPLAVDHQEPKQQSEVFESVMESDDASNAVLTEHSSDKPNIDYLALITTTTEGLTIGEAQQINKRRRELGLPALQEKTNEGAPPPNLERPFKSEQINNLYQSSLNKTEQEIEDPKLDEEGEELTDASSEAISQ